MNLLQIDVPRRGLQRAALVVVLSLAGLTDTDPAITASTYPFSSAAGVALEDMSTGTTLLTPANVDSYASAINDNGFDFWYDGARQTRCSVNSDGLCHLGSPQISTASTNSLANTTDAPKIAPYWDDLLSGTNRKVHYKVVGIAPNRKLVVEWLDEQIPRTVPTSPALVRSRCGCLKPPA